MGVRGLTTYINNKKDSFLKPHYLYNTQLVVDGHSLVAQLYVGSNCFSAFGGDYDKYAAYVKKFFQRLKKCNISCYILFDGSYEKRKLGTAYSRLRSKIFGASLLDPVSQSSLRIFPLFLRDVFKNVLNEMQIPYSICEFEADDEIATMARHLNCPVLSYDSDFFIYNVLYIPFNTLNSKPTIIEEDGQRIVALECQIYRVENMLQHFGGLQQDILPLLATLVGNDYVKKKVFNKFFSHLKLPKSRKKVPEQQRSIHGILKWLQNETLESAIEKIIGRFKKQSKRKVYSILMNSIEGYNKKYCRSLQYFGFNCTEEISTSAISHDLDKSDSDSDESTEQSDSESESESEKDTEKEFQTESKGETVIANNIDDDVNNLPSYIVEGIRHGTIPQACINLYTHNLYFCSPQAEDYTQEDSFLCVLPLLRYSFDILTDYSNDNFIYVSRDKLQYKRIPIGRDYGLKNPYEVTENIISCDRVGLYFNYFLKEKFPSLDLNLLESLPTNFYLPMLSVLWWVSNCNVPQSYVCSVFLCYIFLQAIDERIGMQRNHSYFLKKYSKKLEELKKRPATAVECSELFLNGNKVLYEDSMIAGSELLMFFEIDSEISKHPKTYDKDRVHKFAQFQCCLQQFNYLNTLCHSPYESSKIFDFINGTFLYNVSKKLDKHKEPLLFVEQSILRNAKTVLLFFKSLYNRYDQCISQLGISMATNDSTKGRRRKKKKESSFLDDDFEFEVTI